MKYEVLDLTKKMPLTCLVRICLVNEDIVFGPMICLKAKAESEGSKQVGLS